MKHTGNYLSRNYLLEIQIYFKLPKPTNNYIFYPKFSFVIDHIIRVSPSISAPLQSPVKASFFQRKSHSNRTPSYWDLSL